MKNIINILLLSGVISVAAYSGDSMDVDAEGSDPSAMNGALDDNSNTNNIDNADAVDSPMGYDTTQGYNANSDGGDVADTAMQDQDYTYDPQSPISSSDKENVTPEPTSRRLSFSPSSEDSSLSSEASSSPDGESQSLGASQLHSPIAQGYHSSLRGNVPTQTHGASHNGGQMTFSQITENYILVRSSLLNLLKDPRNINAFNRWFRAKLQNRLIVAKGIGLNTNVYKQVMARLDAQNAQKLKLLMTRLCDFYREKTDTVNPTSAHAPQQTAVPHSHKRQRVSHSNSPLSSYN